MCKLNFKFWTFGVRKEIYILLVLAQPRIYPNPNPNPKESAPTVRKAHQKCKESAP